MSMSTQAQPHVSQYRLAAHLGMALALYSLMFYQGLAHILKPEKVGFFRLKSILCTGDYFYVFLFQPKHVKNHGL